MIIYYKGDKYADCIIPLILYLIDGIVIGGIYLCIICKT